MSTSLSIASMGLVCSVGHDPLEAYASVRAGSGSFRKTHLMGRAGPIVAAAALQLAPDCEGLERAHALSDRAFRDALAPVSSRLRGARVGLVVTTGSLGYADDERLPPLPSERLSTLRDAWKQLPVLAKLVLEGAGCRIADGALCLLREGQASGLMGLQMASAIAERFDLEFVVLVSIASNCDRFQLEVLDALGLLRSEANSEGWVPSEGAAVMVLERSSSGAPFTAAFAREESGRPPETQGVALAAAVSAALRRSGVRATDIAEVWTDQNGERWRAHEWAHAAARSLGVHGGAPPVIHPADVFGDLGAVAGTTLAILGSLAAREHGRPVLVTASSRGPFRGAAIIVPPGPGAQSP